MAVPVEGGLMGLDSEVSEHFGHCGCFMVVEVEGMRLRVSGVLGNPPHESHGCAGPVTLLTGAGVRAVAVRGIGPRPLAKLDDAGIAVYLAPDATTVREVGLALADGALLPLRTSSCAGHCHD